MRPLLAQILVVLLPVALLAALGGRLVDAERERERRAFLEPRAAELASGAERVALHLASRRRLLRDLLLEEEPAPERLRALAAKVPEALVFFRQAPDGRMIHPSPEGPLAEEERDFLERMRKPIEERTLFAGAEVAPPPVESRSYGKGGGSYGKGGESSAKGGPVAQRRPPPLRFPVRERGEDPETGWLIRWRDDGMRLVYRLRLADGSVAGAELSRVRLLADLAALLPEAPFGLSPLVGRLALVDGDGRPVAHWGGDGFEPHPGMPPSLERALDPPLSAFRLTCHLRPDRIPGERGGAAAIPVAVTILSIGLALVWLSAYLRRESRRVALEATRRVDFVNRVSHELKTPLTNIRLHAELLEEALPDDPEAARRVRIIVAEVRRLARLIGNVLAFSRHRRGAPELRPALGSPDEVIRETLEGFRPSLAQRGVEAELRLGAPGPARFDRDALEQILGNIIGNVEKYAATGRYLGIASTQDGAATTIEVADRGPGIPPAQAERIFEPFERLTDRLSEGASGTGLGLPIARDLARAHGGDVTCRRTDAGGATFVITLATPGMDADAKDESTSDSAGDATNATEGTGDAS